MPATDVRREHPAPRGSRPAAHRSSDGASAASSGRATTARCSSTVSPPTAGRTSRPPSCPDDRVESAARTAAARPTVTLHSTGPSAKPALALEHRRVPDCRAGEAGAGLPVVRRGHRPTQRFVHPSRRTTPYGEDDRFRRGGAPRARARHEHPRRRRQGDARPQGPQRRPGEEVGRAHHHQRWCVDRQGDRARGPVGEDRGRAGQGSCQEDRRHRR